MEPSRQPNPYQQQQPTQQPNPYQQQQPTQQPNPYQQQQPTQQPNPYQQPSQPPQQQPIPEPEPKKGGAGLIVGIIILILVVGAAFFTFNWAFGAKQVVLYDGEENCDTFFDEINRDRYSTQRPSDVVMYTEDENCDSAFEISKIGRIDPLTWGEFERVVQTACTEICDDAGFSDVNMGESSCPKGGYPTCQCSGNWINPEADYKEPKLTWEEFEAAILKPGCEEICDDEGYSKSVPKKSHCPKGGNPVCFCKRY